MRILVHVSRVSRVWLTTVQHNAFTYAAHLYSLYVFCWCSVGYTKVCQERYMSVTYNNKLLLCDTITYIILTSGVCLLQILYWVCTTTGNRFTTQVRGGIYVVPNKTQDIFPVAAYSYWDYKNQKITPLLPVRCMVFLTCTKQLYYTGKAG